MVEQHREKGERRTRLRVQYPDFRAGVPCERKIARLLIDAPRMFIENVATKCGSNWLHGLGGCDIVIIGKCFFLSFPPIPGMFYVINTDRVSRHFSPLSSSPQKTLAEGKKHRFAQKYLHFRFIERSV